jgi:Immunity protein 49
MASYFLPVFRNNAFLELTERVGAVQAATMNLETVLAFCQWYRIQGICSLFLDGRPDSFLIDLHKSGRAFLHYLVRAPMSQKVTSRAAPFFDAIGSGDWTCARDIARNSRLTWNAEEEFEDDFQFFLFLTKHFFLDGTRAECAAILERFGEILDGAPDPHFDICRAFAADDAEQFGRALAELLQNHESHYQKVISDDAVAPEEAATESKLCVEGLALVKLAEAKAFPLDDDYLLIPSTARESVTVVFGTDDWESP